MGMTQKRVILEGEAGGRRKGKKGNFLDEEISRQRERKIVIAVSGFHTSHPFPFLTLFFLLILFSSTSVPSSPFSHMFSTNQKFHTWCLYPTYLAPHPCKTTKPEIWPLFPPSCHPPPQTSSASHSQIYEYYEKTKKHFNNGLWLDMETSVRMFSSFYLKQLVFVSEKWKRNEGGVFGKNSWRNWTWLCRKLKLSFRISHLPAGRVNVKSVWKHCTKCSVVLESGFYCGMLGIVSRSK